MISDQWYSVKRDKDSKVHYVICGGNRRMIEATAKGMYRDPIIVKLTWMMMKVLTGCEIPTDKVMTSFCRGEIMLPRRDNLDIVIKVL